MSLNLKLALAFGSSLLVTIALALATQWTTQRIQSEQIRLHLSQQQLQTLEALLAKLAQRENVIEQYMHDPRAETLADVITKGRLAEALVQRLIDQNQNELESLEDDSRAGLEDDKLEQEEARRLNRLPQLLREQRAIVAGATSDPGNPDRQALVTLLAWIRSEDSLDLARTIETLADEEAEAVERRQNRLDHLMAAVSHFTGVGVLVAGGICIGAIILLSASIRDVNRAREREKAANNAKSSFLANMSHEIRTPLNSIIGFTHLLMRRSELMCDPDIQLHLITIDSSGQHLLELINDILDLSRVEAGQLECRRDEFKVLEVLEDVVSVLRPTAIAKSVALEFQWLGRVPATINSDRARLKQILINLVGNAVKFTDEGGVTLKARVEKRDDGWKLVAKVIDTGVGIDNDQLDHIFHPFQQADTSLTRGFEGTGLGLTISQRLAQMLGGDIDVASRLGEGSTFTLTIDAGEIDPATMHDVPTTSRPRPMVPASQAVDVSLAGRRILVVDDGKTNRELIRILLKGAQAEVLEADNGLKGVKMAIANQPHAVLMDVQMPVMDGLAATGRLRQHGFTGPVIALTAHAMEGDRQKCLDAGCSGYIAKPIDANALMTEVARQLGVTPTAQPSEPAPQPTRPIAAELRCSLPPDPEYLAIAREFIADFQVRLDDFSRLREHHCWDELAADAHWLKGAGGTAGFGALTVPASRLEQAARTADIEQVDRELELLRQLSQAVPPEFLVAAEGIA